MGKLSDVIRHAGELSEETDDEDLWEEESDAQADEEPFREEESDTQADEEPDAQTGEEPVWEESSQEISGGSSAPEEEPDSSESLPERSGSPVVWNTPAQDDADGAENPDGEDRENSAGQPDLQEEENGEPECNEEGIPLKDVVYAESMKNRGKDLIVVQSVMNRKIMLDFLLRHAYLSTSGYTGLIISLCAIGAAIYTYGRIQPWLSLLLLIAGCLFVVLEPFMLRDRAKQMTSRGGQFHIPITYVLTPYSIELTRNGNHASYNWGEITRVTTTKYAVILYKGRHTAFILTKKGIGDQKEDLYAMIRRCANSAKYMKLK